MRKLFIFLAVIPSLVFGVSFDCNKATSLNERIICNDNELSLLDDELYVVYKQAKLEASNQEIFKLQNRNAWIWREKNCSTRECLLSWYLNRKTILQKILEPQAVPEQKTETKIDSKTGNDEWVTPQPVNR